MTNDEQDPETEDLFWEAGERLDESTGLGRHPSRAERDPAGEGWGEDESGHSWAQYFHDPVREPYGGSSGSGQLHPYGGRRFAWGRDSGTHKSDGQLYGYDQRGFGHRRDSFYATAGATPWWELEPSAEDSAPESRGFGGVGSRGYKRPDGRIEEEVVQRLEEADWVDATDVEVEVADGVVTLAGEVETREERRAAADVAAEVAGVVDVINRLRSRQRRSMH